ncbi:GNAT family N-acetyltransferase [Candidatus Woesebacteria bacterium]|nr:GNAT family N-acetyltransferase [Candidatus Woesebacteria bacterium]
MPGALRDKFKTYIAQAIKKDDPYILIAKEKEEIVGFITFEDSKTNYLDTNIVKHGNILELFVSQKFRKRGIGKMLMD